MDRLGSQIGFAWEANMTGIDNLIDAADNCGLKMYDKEEFVRIVDYEIQNGQFHFVEYEGKTIGFFGWLINRDEEGLGVFINNMFISPRHKKDFNIFDMCKFFKEKYPDIYKLEWHSQNKDEFKKLILKGRKI